jgi:hypothetical protein
MPHKPEEAQKAWDSADMRLDDLKTKGRVLASSKRISKDQEEG